MQRFLEKRYQLKKCFMKLSFLLFITGICALQCKKNGAPNGPVLTGKLVVNAACGHYAIQVLDENIDSSEIVASWKNPDTDSTFTNVFTVANICSFQSLGLSQGDIFTFQLDANPSAQTCAVCQIYYPTPGKVNSVKNVKKIN